MGIAWLLLVAGCGGQPQVGAENFPLVESLRTAVSAKNDDWLERNASLVERRHAAGKLTDEGRAALDAIIAKARSGQWTEAEADTVALAKAQRPDSPRVADPPPADTPAAK